MVKCISFLIILIAPDVLNIFERKFQNRRIFSWKYDLSFRVDTLLSLHKINSDQRRRSRHIYKRRLFALSPEEDTSRR